MKLRWTIHLHLSTVFAVIFVVVAAVGATQRYRATSDMLIANARDVVQAVTREANSQLGHSIEGATMAVNMVSRSTLPPPGDPQSQTALLPLLQQSLRASSSLVSVYVGYGNGDMFLLRRLRTEEDRQLFKAPDGTRYILQLIDRSKPEPVGRFLYMDEDLNSLKEEDRPEYAASYDPRKRGWYRDAFRAGETVASEPYVFFTTRRVGLTLSTPVENSRTVVGADLGVETLGQLLKGLKITPGTQLALALPDGRMFAHEDSQRVAKVSADNASPTLNTLADSGIPVLQALYPRVRDLDQELTQTGRIEAGDRHWYSSITPVSVRGGLKLQLAMAVPEDELMAEAKSQRSEALRDALLMALLAIGVVVWVARRVARPIRDLAREARSIQRFDFSRPVEVDSAIVEVHRLAETIDGMKSTIRRFLTISEALASEQDFDRLLQLLLEETKSAVDAKAAVLYLAGDASLKPGAKLIPGHDGTMEPLPTLALAENSLPSRAMAALEPVQAELDAAQRRSLGLPDEVDGAALAHAVAVPLANRQGQPVGCLLLLSPKVFQDNHISFIRALSGSAASALEARELIRSQKDLFEAFIRLIAGAIDAKSPYTGGHCERVPELTKMLARAASAQTEGPWRDFKLQETDWEAVHVAAWLHDCGKITTPEFVVDKATKLETIYDRIHEVRMRFEVLKRDAQIQALRDEQGGADPEAVRARLEEALRQLNDDFAFVALCNEGGEFLGPDRIQRLRDIGARTWQRTLDDRIGISQEELRRKAQVPPMPLPATETLLADKPEHRIERPERERLAPDNAWGFRMEVPELLYHRGELHNLAISRGTLTEEDRFKINEHIVQTIKMLSTLPFPKHLRAVAEIAGGHHEKMDGTGYPKRLQGADMSPVARMMAIADVFEALTAADRPYKKAKTLSQALKIMSSMVREQHIDGELFDLFLREGVWQEYAQRFLLPEQIDAVRVEDFRVAA